MLADGVKSIVLSHRSSVSSLKYFKELKEGSSDIRPEETGRDS
jgi:hypothetical protein